MELIWHFIIFLPGEQREEGGLGPAAEQPPSKELCSSLSIFGILEPWSPPPSSSSPT